MNFIEANQIKISPLKTCKEDGQKTIFILIPSTYTSWEDDKVYPRGKRVEKSRGSALKDTQLTGLYAHSSGIPSSSFPVLSHILQGSALLSSAAIAATIASAGTGHWGVTRGTPAVSLTGCDTLLLTILSTKEADDTTWQLSVALQALMAGWVASLHPTIALRSQNGQWWQHGKDLLKGFIQQEVALLK